MRITAVRKTGKAALGFLKPRLKNQVMTAEKARPIRRGTPRPVVSRRLRGLAPNGFMVIR
jgi:hypothetical protein